jgi:hypothetical protein
MVRRADKGTRELYEKPVVRRVKLVKGELAAVGCKTPASHMGPAVGCVRFGTCKMPGS